jgi:hypothetical protein
MTNPPSAPVKRKVTGKCKNMGLLIIGRNIRLLLSMKPLAMLLRMSTIKKPQLQQVSTNIWQDPTKHLDITINLYKYERERWGTIL